MKASSSPNSSIENLASHIKRGRDQETEQRSEKLIQELKNKEIWTKELPVGTEVQHYIIRKVLGEGGFGITYLAYDQLLDRHVVLKENFPANFAFREPSSGRVLPRSLSDTEHYNWALRHFIGEARTIAGLDHPGIVRVLSIFECNDTAYFAMDYIHGLSLEHLGRRMMDKEKRFSTDELESLLIRILDTLIYMHEQNICHRDLKPSNILLSKAGTPILIDFGAAKESNNSNTTKVMASHGYSSPEQALNLKQSGGWSDLYSLAASIFFILMGRAPERSESRIMEDKEIKLSKQASLLLLYPVAFLASIDKALEPRIDFRYKTAEQWLHALPPLDANNMQSIVISNEELASTGLDISDKFATHSRYRKTSSHTSYAPQKRNVKQAFIVMVTALCLCVGTITYLLFNKTVLETEEVAAPQIEPIDINRIPISRLAYHEEIPKEAKNVRGFLIELNNPYLIGQGNLTTLPKEINLSSLVLQKGNELDMSKGNTPSEELFLEIYDSTWTLIARSQNAVAIAPLFQDSLFMYVFPHNPRLDTEKTYHASFINRAGLPHDASIKLLVENNTKKNERTAHARYYGEPNPEKGSPLLTTPLAKEIQLVLNSFNTRQAINLDAIPSQAESIPILLELEQIGSAWAGYALYQKYYHGINTPVNLHEAYIHLYRAAWKGCYLAQRELASSHSTNNKIFPNTEIVFPNVKQDETLTYSFFRFASNQGDPVSRLLLGFHYSQGWGVPKSRARAEESITYAGKSKIEFNTNAVRPKAKFFCYWTPLYMAPQQKTPIKLTLKDLDLSTFQGIRLVSINNNFVCSFSNFRLSYKGTVISTHTEPIHLHAENLAEELNMPVPASYSENEPADFTLEFDGKSSGGSYGIIEVL